MRQRIPLALAVKCRSIEVVVLVLPMQTLLPPWSRVSVLLPIVDVRRGPFQRRQWHGKADSRLLRIASTRSAWRRSRGRRSASLGTRQCHLCRRSRLLGTPTSRRGRLEHDRILAICSSADSRPAALAPIQAVLAMKLSLASPLLRLEVLVLADQTRKHQDRSEVIPVADHLDTAWDASQRGSLTAMDQLPPCASQGLSASQRLVTPLLAPSWSSLLLEFAQWALSIVPSDWWALKYCQKVSTSLVPEELSQVLDTPSAVELSVRVIVTVGGPNSRPWQRHLRWVLPCRRSREPQGWVHPRRLDESHHKCLQIPLAAAENHLLCPVKAILGLVDIFGKDKCFGDTPVFQVPDGNGSFTPILRHKFDLWFKPVSYTHLTLPTTPYV